MPKTTLRVVEDGESETIDGKEGHWVRVEAQGGYKGWCFSAYLVLVPPNPVELLAAEFKKTKNGSFKGIASLDPIDSVRSLVEISNASGIYIQQRPREFQGQGRLPEILRLQVSEGQVYVQTIDLVNGTEIVSPRILFAFDGKKFSHGESEIVKYRNSVSILYYESPKELRQGREYSNEEVNIYTFAGSITDNLPDVARRLTTDYLKSYIGKYTVQSSSLEISKEIDTNPIIWSGLTIHVSYEPNSKTLSIPYNELRNLISREGSPRTGKHLFVETDPSEPFYWAYGEGNGFVEDKIFFYLGGIAVTHEYFRYKFDSNENIIGEVHQRYAIFLERKDDDEPNI